MTIEEAKKLIAASYSDSECVVTFGKAEAFEPSDGVFDIYPKDKKEAMETLCRNGIVVNLNFKVGKKKKKLKGSNIEDVDATPEVLDYQKSLKASAFDKQKAKIEELEQMLVKSDSDYMNKVHLACERGREIARLNGIIHEKNELIQNLINAHGKKARELQAEKALHRMDLQATESSERALAYKEREYEKSLKEKDEVIEDISKELARSKHREEELLETIKDYLAEIHELRCKPISLHDGNGKRKHEHYEPYEEIEKLAEEIFEQTKRRYLWQHQ